MLVLSKHSNIKAKYYKRASTVQNNCKQKFEEMNVKKIRSQNSDRIQRMQSNDITKKLSINKIFKFQTKQKFIVQQHR